MGFNSSGLIEIGGYSGRKTTVGVRLAMEQGEYRRIREMRSPVAEETKEKLTIYKMKQKIEEARSKKNEQAQQ